MGDIAQGPGVDAANLGLPSYNDLVAKLDDGTRAKLEQASQALQTAQLTHSLLSNYKPYRDLTKNLSEAIFDPVKAEFKQATGKLIKNVAGKFNPTGEGEGGITSKMLNYLGDNPEDLLKLAKNPKKFGKSLLNRAIENSDLTAEEKQIAQAAAEGKVSAKSAGKALLNRVIDKADIPDEAKSLARSAAEGKVGRAEGKQLVNSIIDKSDLPDDVKALAKSSVEAGKVDTQKLIKTAIDRAPLTPEAKLLAQRASEGKVPGLDDARDVLGKLIDSSPLSEDQKALAKAAATGSRAKFVDEAKARMNKAIDESNIDPDVKTVIKNAVNGQELKPEAKQYMSEFLDNSDMPASAKTLTKALISGDARSVVGNASSMLNDVIDSSKSPEPVKNLVRSVLKGKEPKIADAKAAMDSVLPDEVKAQLPEFESISKLPTTAAAKAKLAPEIVEKRLGKLPEDVVNNLRSAGLDDSEIAANADRNIDFSKIMQQAPQRLLDPSEITVDAPDLGLADAQKAYRTSKYMESLKTPAAESGAARGDSTIARALQANSDEPAPEVKIGPYKSKSRAQIKQEAKARKAGKPVQQEEAGPAQEQPAKPGVQTEQTINQNREVADPALQSFVEESAKVPPKPNPVSEIEPAPEQGAKPTTEPTAKPKVPVTEEEGITAGDIASGASEALGVGVGAAGLAQSIQQRNTGGEVMAGTQLGADIGGKAFIAAGEAAAKSGAVTGEAAAAAESGATKAASGLQEATDESLAEDEDPVGAGISAVLEVATLATMLAGIFAPKPKAPVVVGGYQSGV